MKVLRESLMNSGNIKKANVSQISALYAEKVSSAFNLVQGAIIKQLVAFLT
jgi:hypothetical protein